MKYTITQTRLLYVYTINDSKHKGLLKVGEVLVDNDVAKNKDMSVLMKAVRSVLDGYTDENGKLHSGRSYLKDVKYHLEYVESTTYDEVKCYKAEDVHNCLRHSGVSVLYLNKYNKEKADIWFQCTLNQVILAIKAVKNGKKTFNDTDEKVPPQKIIFRPEQAAAIKQTVETLSKKTKNDFLWNAKMRFGKTVCGLQVARELEVKTTLIVTHRPVVDDGWHNDFDKIFGNLGEKYAYRTRFIGDEKNKFDFKKITQNAESDKQRLVFFVSIQYLRLSDLVGGKNTEKLKRDIMQYPWELVMVDEAHEGTESTMGKRVIEQLRKPTTKVLSLSGTPFNLLDKYEEDQIYTWDYVMEQQARREWDDQHFGDPNPYDVLPRMQILTFTLSQMLRSQLGDNNVFKFHEFFRVWTGNEKEDGREMPSADLKGRFIYEQQVNEFLDRLCETSKTSQYPFSDREFRQQFRHTFWLLPYVKEAAAMEALLNKHKVFKNFHVVNVAGDGNMEDPNGSALAEVQDAIKKNQYTITLSCGKLTTGVSVPQWTAVLCMKGSDDTPAAGYMQTIFRVQTPAALGGRQKSDAYVFDFAPDRALTAVAETAKVQASVASGGKGKITKTSQQEEEHQLASFLELCPVISMDGAQMDHHFTAHDLFEKLKNVYVERAVRSGYADNSLYNPETLMNLTPEQEQELNKVHGLLGSMPASWKPDKITVNNQGFAGTEGAEEVQYIYYLSNTKKNPAKPTASSSNSFPNGAPKPIGGSWMVVMPTVSKEHPYLFVAHCEKRNGKWGRKYSDPALWKEWHESNEDNGENGTKKEKTEEQKRKEQEAREKRARMSVLRGVSIRIPLLVYGADINDDKGEEITIDNFTSLVDDASWEEYMPKGFSKQMFNSLKECFDRTIFTGAARRIRKMVEAADKLDIEDRINQIALIFSYFHNPDKETVLTPWRVVNRHISDTLGGWCFFNEEFDDNYKEENEYQEEVNSVRFVDRGQVTADVFGDNFTRILEINSKTGLYPLYMAYSVFREAKEVEYRKYELTGERSKGNGDDQHYDRQAKDDLEIWKDVLQDNIFVICRTPMAVSITKRTLAGSIKGVHLNVKCYEHKVDVNDLVAKGVLKRDLFGVTRDGLTYLYKNRKSIQCDMIDVLRAKPEYFRKDVVKAKDKWKVYNAFPLKTNENINNMRFTAIVGNPPYMLTDKGNGASDAAAPIYHRFVEAAKGLSPAYISMIMPSKWMVGGRSELAPFLDSMKNDKKLAYLKDYRNDRTIFPAAHNDGGICYFLWDSLKTSSGLDYEYINMEGEVVHNSSLSNKFTSYVIRDSRIVPILEKIFQNQDITQFSSIVSKTRPFGVRKDIFNSPEKYPDMDMNVKPFNNSVHIFGVKGIKGGAKRMDGYVDKGIITDKYKAVDKYKIFFTTTYSSDAKTPPEIIEGQINDVCTETFLLVGPFDTIAEMKSCASYINSKFFRFLLFFGHGTMQVNQSVFSLIPLVEFNHIWNDTLLFEKFHLSAEDIGYINMVLE